MVCNGLYVHNIVNTDCNRNAFLRKAISPVEREIIVNMIAITTFILNIIAIIAVIIFIIHTASVHKHMNDVFKRMNKTIDDISIHLNIIKETNDNLAEVHNKLNICTNGITEIMSKQRRYRAIDDKNATNNINTIKEYLTKIDAKIEAKNSFGNSNLNKTSSFKKKDNTKLKIANTANSIRNKKNTSK